MKTMMKLSTVFFCISALAVQAARAEKVKVLIAADSAPGYVMEEDQYWKDCQIDVNGLLTYQYWTPPFKKPTKVRTHQLSNRQLSNLQVLIDEARTDQSKMPKDKHEYETFAGDAPDFGIEVLPADALSFIIRSEGRDLTVYSTSAKKLEKKLGRLCGMSFEFRMIRLALKQMSEH